jgi:hypothetical protein
MRAILQSLAEERYNELAARCESERAGPAEGRVCTPGTHQNHPKTESYAFSPIGMRMRGEEVQTIAETLRLDIFPNRRGVWAVDLSVC